MRKYQHARYVRKIIAFLKTNKWVIVCTLAILVLLTTVAILFRNGVITENLLVAKKESFALIFKFVEVSIVGIAAMLAYFRFFKGHLFLSKLNFSVSHKMVVLGENENYHFFEIEIDNFGDYTITNPIVSATISYVPENRGPETLPIKDGQPRLNERQRKVNHVVRAKTVTSLAFDTTVADSSIKALKVEVQVAHRKRTWKRIILVENG